jgi:hypothetical protein
LSEEEAARSLLERLRQTGLRLDREGRWWHEGEPVRHEGLARALHRWIDQLPDGRPVLRLDAVRYAYFECEDTPFVVRSARREGGSFLLWLSDETEERLDPATLSRRGEGLYCLVKDGRFPARLAHAAVYALGDALREEGGGLVLEVEGREFPIR